MKAFLSQKKRENEKFHQNHSTRIKGMIPLHNIRRSTRGPKNTMAESNKNQRAIIRTGGRNPKCIKMNTSHLHPFKQPQTADANDQEKEMQRGVEVFVWRRRKVIQGKGREGKGGRGNGDGDPSRQVSYAKWSDTNGRIIGGRLYFAWCGARKRCLLVTSFVILF